MQDRQQTRRVSTGRDMHQQQQQQKEEKDDALMRMIPRMLPNFEFLPGTVKMLWSQ